MEFTAADIEIEFLSVEQSGIVLASSADICSVCKIGKVVSVGMETEIVLYTRSGTKKGVHVEKRCNNRTLSWRSRCTK